jgi:preprotein translocase subunit YajC
MSFLISTAHAAPAAAQGPSLMANLLMIAVFIASSILDLETSSKTC